MSYIDTIRHEIVGQFAGHPVYHPRSTRLAARGALDFGCTPRNLVVGAGSGGHPGLVIHNFEGLVVQFLLNGIDNHRIEQALSRACPTGAMERLEAYLLNRRGRSLFEHFEYCGWGLEQLARFLCACRDPAKSTVPFHPDRHHTAEHWLACGFGEYCWHRQPQLAEKLIGGLKAESEFSAALAEVSRPIFRNVRRADRASASA